VRRIGRTELAWAFYDWANSASHDRDGRLLPRLLQAVLAAGLTPTTAPSSWAWATRWRASSCWCSPLIGAIADRGGLKLRLLLLFTVLGVR